MITVSAIGATLLQSLDQTIANVALPYMQGSFSASFDEITWVLTSYITAAAIMTAPVGWLATRFGRKPLFIGCILGFTIASMLCGAAQSLAQIVGFRLLQGMFSAALVPLSQATLLDIYPPERRGFAMAIWGMGVMIGPIMGPTLGGYLTDHYDWRWVFYINLPFGLLAAAGLLIFLPNMRDTSGVAVRLAGIRRAVHRHRCAATDAGPRPGPGLVLVAGDHHRGCAGRAGASICSPCTCFPPASRCCDQPCSETGISCSGLVLMFAVGTLLVSSLALMTPWLQVLSDYPVQTAGMIMAPRGLGNFTAIMISGRLTTRTDPRYLVGAGPDPVVRLVLHHDRVDARCFAADSIILTIILQGFGLGLVFMPLQILAFATLAPRCGPRVPRCSPCCAISARRSAYRSLRLCWRATPRRCTR